MNGDKAKQRNSIPLNQKVINNQLGIASIFN